MDHGRVGGSLLFSCPKAHHFYIKRVISTIMHDLIEGKEGGKSDVFRLK
jgi:hypothetical protein